MKPGLCLWICLFAALTVAAQLDYAKQIAQTVMTNYKDSMVVKKFANHLLQDNQVKPGQTLAEAQANRPASWTYEIGVVLIPHRRSAQQCLCTLAVDEFPTTTFNGTNQNTETGRGTAAILLVCIL